MIEIGKMIFGDVIYKITRKSNVMQNRKITMVDDEGNEWYRYIMPKFTYDIEPLVYTGRVIFAESGKTRFDEDRYNEYHFRYSTDEIHPIYEHEFEEDDMRYKKFVEYHHTFNDAEKEAERMMKEDDD